MKYQKETRRGKPTEDQSDVQSANHLHDLPKLPVKLVILVPLAWNELNNKGGGVCDKPRPSKVKKTTIITIPVHGFKYLEREKDTGSVDHLGYLWVHKMPEVAYFWNHKLTKDDTLLDRKLLIDNDLWHYLIFTFFLSFLIKGNLT